MVKKYSWQRWPSKKKSTASPKPTVQTSDPSWKNSSINDLHTEERKASRDYGRMAKTAPTKEDAETMRVMSEDEARHARNLEKMKH